MVVRIYLNNGIDVLTVSEEEKEIQDIIQRIINNNGWYLCKNIAVHQDQIEHIELEPENVDEFLNLKVLDFSKDKDKKEEGEE